MTRTAMKSVLVDYLANIAVTDAPTLQRKYSSQQIQPDLLTVNYREGAHGWEVTSVKVHGPNIKKDGHLGVNRYTETIWTSDLHAAPEWVREAVNSYVPRGRLR